jgi:hypothetical protein
MFQPGDHVAYCVQNDTTHTVNWLCGTVVREHKNNVTDVAFIDGTTKTVDTQILTKVETLHVSPNTSKAASTSASAAGVVTTMAAEFVAKIEAVRASPEKAASAMARALFHITQTQLALQMPDQSLASGCLSMAHDQLADFLGVAPTEAP